MLHELFNCYFDANVRSGGGGKDCVREGIGSMKTTGMRRVCCVRNAA